MRIALGVVVFWLFVAVLADVLSGDPNAVDKSVAPFSPPDAHHMLGTDAARRDVYARLVHGTRQTIFVGGLAVAVLLVVGVFAGVLAGYAPPLVDALVMRATDAVLALPILFVVLAVTGALPDAGSSIVACAIGLTAWSPLARMLRLETQRLRASEFVSAARLMGAGPFYIVRRHIAPHLAHLIAVAAAFGFATATMVHAGLAFLGFGAPDTTASWGGLMRHGEQHIAAWWLVVVPGLALVTLTLAVSTLGDGLRHWRKASRPDSVGEHG